jgi:hypothetical protein
MDAGAVVEIEIESCPFLILSPFFHIRCRCRFQANRSPAAAG